MAATKKKAGTPEKLAPEPQLIPVDKIRRNPKNPRIEFKPGPLERLAESIEKTGVLVPLTVYRDTKQADGTEFVLLDGERRWRAAKDINEESVPAWVIAKPTGAENVQRMFNIHMLREPWGDIATTWALQDLMQETKVTDDKELRQMTGLSLDTLRNMKPVLAFPKSWQDKVFSGAIPFNLLVELDKAVLSRARDDSKKPALKKTEAQLREVFLKKYENGAFQDVVELRKVASLIDTAAGTGKVGQRAQKALDNLVTQPKATIRDAFEVGAAASIEIGRVLNDLANLPDRLSDLASTDLEEEQRTTLRTALVSLRNNLDDLIDQLA